MPIDPIALRDELKTKLDEAEALYDQTPLLPADRDANKLISANAFAQAIATHVNTAGGGSIRFRDEVIPDGPIDNVNAAYSLPEAPLPVASLRLYRNGQLQRRGVDFTLGGVGGNIITYTTPLVDSGGYVEWHLAFYRY